MAKLFRLFFIWTLIRWGLIVAVGIIVAITVRDLGWGGVGLLK